MEIKKSAVIPVYLLNEGAQNSFITEELAQKIDVQSQGSITQKTSAPGDKNSEIRNLEKATEQLVTQTGDKIPLEVVIIPKIAAPISNRSRVNIKELSYGKGLELTHPISTDEKYYNSMLMVHTTTTGA